MIVGNADMTGPAVEGGLKITNSNKNKCVSETPGLPDAGNSAVQTQSVHKPRLPSGLVLDGNMSSYDGVKTFAKGTSPGSINRETSS